jgi:hypothetical protein
MTVVRGHMCLADLFDVLTLSIGQSVFMLGVADSR